MIYRFTIISDEVDDFVREIQIDPEATFYDFHEAILKSVGYANDQMTSFFICDDDWEKGKEVTLEEVRGKLAELSQSGKTAAVLELIQKHGGSRLSDVEPSQYAAILKEAEVLANAK